MTSAKPLSSADVRCSMTSSREQLTGNPLLQDYVREPNWLQLSGVAEQILGGAQPSGRTARRDALVPSVKSAPVTTKPLSSTATQCSIRGAAVARSRGYHYRPGAHRIAIGELQL